MMVGTEHHPADNVTIYLHHEDCNTAELIAAGADAQAACLQKGELISKGEGGEMFYSLDTLKMYMRRAPRLVVYTLFIL